jgi:hypothetical protein
MSKFPFVITLLVSGILVVWLHVSADGKSAGASPGPAKAGPASSGRKPSVFGFPDPKGIVLQMSRLPENSCAASRFRGDSPEFVLWDDGTVVYRNSAFDYRKGRFPMQKADEWLRELRAALPRKGSAGCDQFWDPVEGNDWMEIRGRDVKGAVSVNVYSLQRCAGAHAAGCDLCRALKPLAALADSIAHYRKEGDAAMTGIPVEVYLQFKSCGCRNHPEIANISKEWTLPGISPTELCGRASARITLTDPEQIRWLSTALEGSAAVLDKGEIYTCFMRPLLKVQQPEPMAKR